MIREDGDFLFSQVPGNFTNGPLFVDAFGPVFSTPDGTFMTVHTVGVNGAPVNIYRLPGTLPCMDCYGSPQPEPTVVGGIIQGAPPSGMILLPNPAQHEVQVRLDGAVGQADQLIIFDASGRVVLRSAVATKDVTVLSISQLANGRYTVTAVRGDRPIGSSLLLIAR